MLSETSTDTLLQLHCITSEQRVNVVSVENELSLIAFTVTEVLSLIVNGYYFATVSFREEM
jgi:hypothetical protein